MWWASSVQIYFVTIFGALKELAYRSELELVMHFTLIFIRHRSDLLLCLKL